MGADGNRSMEDETETWYNQSVTRLYRFVYGQLQNRAEAEDITQEAYVRCLKMYKGRNGLPPYAYLRQTAQNLIYDRYRRLSAHPISNVDENRPDERMEADEVVNKLFLRDLLNKLPLEARKVLDLRIVQGYSRRETAERMGKSEDAIRGLQYRALQMLRGFMQQVEVKED
ncbi:RNA polymerase sigma factor SigX [Peptococcaceae bacterium CEB3]|nr:RNA polymerase sigma factor SigX [Peptococcaceae bacterium CEB3]